MINNYPTLRDQFAMSALGSILEISGDDFAYVAQKAYAIADAMMAERRKLQ